ncbi:hypothetical protein KMW28_22190 [Flammeovirga yaeyamensis]|uniref:Integrase n=1 Tax=Flammeovirga yaeyamensis TaxID=367791 RepID=A0AAX1NF10_9BACT|nr:MULTISPECIES: hypothetical protein [Flammeovirga]ANQ51380.1 hypothetical protein MY04_4036 [Flammeovirga sp. MY04]MBB3696932.1 hypothetical protein [Flammeovirga yaeyamensis]NMF33595.1 hypothetical protein [Flammeovirga yaeyamensis]QWG05137.1 hypothetical protein KMW28_22190 [Flammeovirga yaeyamensis]
MLKKKVVTKNNKALNKSGIKSKISVAQKQRKLVEQKFERLKKTKPELKLNEKFVEEVRTYMSKRRKSGLGVEERSLKSYMFTIKDKLIKNILED